MRTIVFALLTLVAGAAVAEGSCTFTYNTVSRKIEQRCAGMPTAPLGIQERALLTSGRAKVCVVKTERFGANQIRHAKPDCK